MKNYAYSFAQVYGADAYSSSTYQCNEGAVACGTYAQDSATPDGTVTPTAPNTGFLGVPSQITSFVHSSPLVIIPSILCIALIIAVGVLSLKRLAGSWHRTDNK